MVGIVKSTRDFFLPKENPKRALEELRRAVEESTKVKPPRPVKSNGLDRAHNHVYHRGAK